MVTGYHNIAKHFFSKQGFEHVELLSADGALEAAPAMGSADIILDLVSLVYAFSGFFINGFLSSLCMLQVSTGVTLRENNLKEITNGDILASEGILVANKQSLLDRPGLLQVITLLIPS